MTCPSLDQTTPIRSSVSAANEVPADLSFWGKIGVDSKGYPLLHHLLDTAATACVLWDRWLRPGLRELITGAISPGSENTARAVCAAIAGLHDIGKANKVFQGQLLNKRGGTVFDDIRTQMIGAGFDMAIPVPEILGTHIPDEYKIVLKRHEAVGLYLSGPSLVGPSWPSNEDCVRDRWAGTVIGGHHGRFHPYTGVGTRAPASPPSVNRYLSQLTDERWSAQQHAHRDAVLTGVGVAKDQVELPLTGPSSSTVALLLTGFVMLADWIASGTDAVHDATSITADSVTDPAGWITERIAYFESTIPQSLGIYEDLPDPLTAIMGKYANSLSPLQKAAQQVGRGLWIATETTGAGKTEAALLRHAAIPGEGIMFALPTRATTDAMFDRLTDYFSASRNAASLLHAHRSLHKFYATDSGDGSGLHSTSWLTDTRNALFAPISVGTCDQVLLGALKQKNTPVRLLALANRHVVVDEVHTFDHYQAALLEEMLAWWGRTDTRVTLLSASLPKSVSERYGRAYAGIDIDIAPAYPGHLTVASATAVAVPVVSQRSYTLQVDLRDTVPRNIVETHVGLALRYRKVFPDARIAVVVNQVDRAIEVGRLLAETGFRTIVLHSRMAAGHRTQIADELHAAAGKGSRERGIFVVGTQIIEASLDIDFDHIISDLAPAPSLIQRAGRLWRSTAVVDAVWGVHTNPRPTPCPVLDVVVALGPDGELDPGICLPYLPGELRRTRHALTQLQGTVHIPSDVQQLVDDAVFNPFDAVSWGDDTDGELAAAGQKLAAATHVVVPLHHKHGYQRVLRPEATIRDFSDVTSPDELAESSTRLVEQPTFDGFLVNPTGSSRWVWRGETTTALYSRDVNIMRAVLGLTFPLPERRKLARFGVERIPGFDLADDAERNRRGPVQRNLIPLRLTTTRYDDLLGLRLPPPDDL